MAEVPVEASLNEGALKRFDPYIKEILDTAKYVALYSFVDNVWTKTKVEGSLFVYERTGDPLYNILVLNRLDSKNLVEPITPQLDLQRSEPYLLYRNSEGNIFGIWFCDPAECERLTNLIQKLMERSVSGGPRPQAVASNNGQGVDIFKMLTQAQEAFSSKDGRPIPQRKPSPKEADGTPRSVAEFFAKAGSNESSILTDLARPKTVPESDQPGLLQQLMANPAHSVEHIEKQQRVVTPHSADPGLDPLMQFLRPHSSGIDFLQSSVIGEGPKPQPLPSGNGSIGAQLDRASHPGFPLENEGIKPHIPGNGYVGPSPFDRTVSHPGFPIVTERPKPSQPTPGVNGFMGLTLNRNSTPPGFPAPDEEKKLDLMPPAMFTPREPAAMMIAREPPIPPEPLTRNQLLQAFDYLLRNDPDFMTKLHQAYVKSLTEKFV